MIAVLDIGSNSVRLMLDNNGITEKFITTTRLGEGLNATGILNPIAVKRTVDAVKEHVDKARACNADTIYIYATEAVRAGGNGVEFCRLIESTVGIKVHVLTGKEEAECSFYGAVMASCQYRATIASDNDKNYGVVDIGGASTELVIGNRKEIFYSHSAPCGIVRIKDSAGENVKKINVLLDCLSEHYAKAPIFDELIGIGGTLTSLAAIKLQLKIYDRNAVHGTILSNQDLIELKAMILNVPVTKRIDINGLNPSRIDTIIGGICIAEKVMKLTDKNYITVSESDNLEGYMLMKSEGKL